MQAPPAPKSLLGRHRLLAPSASVRVSPLSYGAMGLGTNGAAFLGECTKERAFEILDAYYDLGGNFVDTADHYQGGQSEEWIGEWMAKTGRRSEMVVATKYSMPSMTGKPVLHSNFGGTGSKTMRVSLDRSLKNLQTDYVDVYFVHCWDYATSIPELMQSLNHFIAQGKVLYLGISNTPAWIVAKANAYARENGLRPFSVYQGMYSAVTRDLERDIIPMCRDEGMAVHAFGTLGRGYLRNPDAPTNGGSRNTPFAKTGREDQVAAVLASVAKRHDNAPVTSIALAYALQKAPYLFPVVGGTKVEQLRQNVEALGLELSKEDVAEIESAYPFDFGYPYSHVTGNKAAQVPSDAANIKSLGHFDYVAPPLATRPHTNADLAAAWQL